MNPKHKNLMSKVRSGDWKTEPISCVCEVMEKYHPLMPVRVCEKPTVAAYPAMGGGWMALCVRHSRKHLPNGAIPTDNLIRGGETWR